MQNVLLVAFMAIWFGGMIALFFRYRIKQRAYLRRFPPVDGIPLDMYVGGGPHSVNRAPRRAMLKRQADPDLEQLRRAAWRRYGALAIWSLTFPLIAFAAYVLLGQLGILHQGS
jgi:hypothetical protein